MNKFTQTVATKQRNSKDKQLLPGNVIPHQWFHQVVDSNNNPDLVAITILSDLVGWCRYFKSELIQEQYPNNPMFKNDALAISYEYLQNKFHISRERIRKAMVRLENLNIISRSVKNIILQDGKRNNQLFIVINQQFFQSCFRDHELDIRAITSPKSSPRIQGDHIIRNKNISKNRSIESNFYDVGEKNKNHTSKTKPTIFVEEKTLKDFYPLNQKQCDKLQRESGREFNLHAMNEILKNISNRLKDRSFKSNNGFMSYMAKIFANELRDAEKINNNDFYIKSNLSNEDKQQHERAILLDEIESSRDMSLDGQLKRKLVNVLSESKAYDLITAYKLCERRGDSAVLQLTRQVEISLLDKNIILSQIKSVFEQNQKDLINPILDLKIEILNLQTKLNKIPNYTDRHSTCRRPVSNIWDKVRDNICKKYGEGVDQVWLSKLEPNIDEENKRVELKAESSLVKDWVKTQYEQLLRQFFKENKYTLDEII